MESKYDKVIKQLRKEFDLDSSYIVEAYNDFEDDELRILLDGGFKIEFFKRLVELIENEQE